MATQFNFNGNLVKLPGVYTNIQSGINNAPLDASYGNVLIVDNRVNTEFSGGAGVQGELSQGE